MTDDSQDMETPRFERGAPLRDPHFRQFTAKQRLNAWRLNMAQRFNKGKIVFPVTSVDHKTIYVVTYPYGVRSPAYSLGYHTGEDHAAPVGSLALATTYGHVVFAGPAANDHGWGADYGIQVVIRTKDGKYDYAHNHMSHVAVKAGDQVGPGQIMGRTGATGNVTGPHSHFEARPAGGGFGSDVHPYLVKARKSH